MIISRNTLYDNNIEKTEGFENGVRTYIEQQDQSEDGLAANWQARFNQYDAEGNLSSQYILYDNGVETNKQTLH